VQARAACLGGGVGGRAREGLAVAGQQEAGVDSGECRQGGKGRAAVVRTINGYPYPELPAYKGYGNVDDASSYIGKVSTALQQPTPWLGKFDSTMIWCNSQGLDCTETNRRGEPARRDPARTHRAGS
jgi:hypothetical protein